MSNDKKFKKGDVVRLKSGGPQMTVINCDNPRYISCNWFISGGAVKESGFPEKSLELAEKGDTEEE